MSKNYDQLPLFEHPAPPKPVRLSAAGPGAIRYTKLVVKARRLLCDDCCLAIHRLGQGVAPYPARAVWRRYGPDGGALLCQAHKDERHNHETD